MKWPSPPTLKVSLTFTLVCAQKNSSERNMNLFYFSEQYNYKNGQKKKKIMFTNEEDRKFLTIP